jgi:hypothetical protein
MGKDKLSVLRVLMEGSSTPLTLTPWSPTVVPSSSEIEFPTLFCSGGEGPTSRPWVRGRGRDRGEDGTLSLEYTNGLIPYFILVLLQYIFSEANQIFKISASGFNHCTPLF